MAPKILILDGGLGTSLIYNYGKTFDDTTPLWSSHLLLTDKTTLLSCQKDFGNIPVDIVLTATYQVSIRGFAQSRTRDHPNGVDITRIPQYLNYAVKIAENAKRNHAKVALSVGPYGACMQPGQEYSGEYDDKHDCVVALQAWHQERLQLFASIPRIQDRLGYLAFETAPRLDEIVAMRRSLSAVPQLATIPFWMSSVYPGEELKLPCGSSVSSAVEAMLDPELAAATPCGIGINCAPVWKLDALVREYELAVADLIDRGRIASWPMLVLYPDGANGKTWNSTTGDWNRAVEVRSADPWEIQIMKVVQGTKQRGNWAQIIVGGCCMAHAEDIKRLRHQSMMA